MGCGRVTDLSPAAAESQHDYRERNKSGARCAVAEVSLDLVIELIAEGLLLEGEPATSSAEQAAERKRLGAALVEAARRWSISVKG